MEGESKIQNKVHSGLRDEKIKQNKAGVYESLCLRVWKCRNTMTAFHWPLQREQRQANAIHQRENNETSKNKASSEWVSWLRSVFFCLILSRECVFFLVNVGRSEFTVSIYTLYEFLPKLVCFGKWERWIGIALPHRVRINIAYIVSLCKSEINILRTLPHFIHFQAKSSLEYTTYLLNTSSAATEEHLVTSMWLLRWIKTDPRQLCALNLNRMPCFSIYTALKCIFWPPSLMPWTTSTEWRTKQREKEREPRGELLKLPSGFLITREHCCGAFSRVRRACDWSGVLFLFSQSRAAQGDVGVLIGLMSIIIEPSRCSTVPGDYLWMAASSIWAKEKPHKSTDSESDMSCTLMETEIIIKNRNLIPGQNCLSEFLMWEIHTRRWPPAAIWVARKDQ